MLKSILPGDFQKFLLLILITLGLNTLNNTIVNALWYIFLLISYYRSDDEPFWLAFFLVTVDGFMGFFGSYSVTIRLFPGLPAIELAQFYILLSLIKTVRIKTKPYVFYNKYLQILLIYYLFLLIWSQLLGYSGELNAYFRILKFGLPLVLFYTIPRLFNAFEKYNRFFGFIFAILILGFFSQLFTLITGLSTADTVELSKEQVSETETFRSFYNPVVTLLGLFGSLMFISLSRECPYNVVYLYLVILAAYGMALLSATRGWIISFSIIFFLSILVINRFKSKRVIGLLVISSIILFLGLSNAKIRDQLIYSKERISTLESVAKGDITAEGTLARLSKRGPRVMEKWAENPIFGWGGSDVAREFTDGHVGNQNLLMTSGIVGFTLIIGFLVYFCYKLLFILRRTNNMFYLRNSVHIFIIFLLGWFLLHSTSGQQFGFGGMPVQIIPQAVFFSFGALVYSKSKEVING